MVRALDLNKNTVLFNTVDRRNDRRNADRDPSEFAEARVDVRKLAPFLSGQQINPSRVICNIEDNRLVHFLLLHDDLSLQFFMPIVSL